MLGGRDSPKIEEEAPGLVSTETECPHVASRQAAAAPAGPPPMIATSTGAGSMMTEGQGEAPHGVFAPRASLGKDSGREVDRTQH